MVDEVPAVESAVAGHNPVSVRGGGDYGQQFPFRPGQAAPALEELQAQRPGPGDIDDGLPQEIVSHGHDTPGAVMPHLHAFHSPPSELLGDVAPVEGDDGIALHRGQGRVPQPSVNGTGEVVPFEPSRHPFLAALLRGAAVPELFGKAPDQRTALVGHRAKQHGGRLSEHFPAVRKNGGQQLFRRAFENGRGYVLFHGKTPFV